MSARPGGVISNRAPDKGSFPLDHFHECDKQAELYNKCVAKHQLLPKRCRKFQIDYLECRMKSGLMEKEEMEKLGFTDNLSWESEEAEQKYLFNKIEQRKQKAFENARTQAEANFKNRFQASQSEVPPQE